MSQECRRCFTVKPLDQFYMYKGVHEKRCKECRAKRTIELRDRTSVGMNPYSIEHQRQVAFISKAYAKYAQTYQEVEIPVQVIGNPLPVPRGLVIKKGENHNLIVIMTWQGVNEYVFETMSPTALFRELKRLEMKVVC